MKTRLFSLGVILLVSGLVLLFSYPLHLMNSIVLNYEHALLVGFVLIGVGVYLIVKR